MYDAIVVGARCAGSPTAMLLARKGHRVLLVDRASFPSDTLSTHYIHQPGVACLERWGLRAQIAQSNCPPLRTYTLDVGPLALKGTPPPAGDVEEAYSPRRSVLDQATDEPSSPRWTTTVPMALRSGAISDRGGPSRLRREPPA